MKFYLPPAARGKAQGAGRLAQGAFRFAHNPPQKLFILWLFFAAHLCFAEGFRVEPYLPDVTADSATIAFHLHKPLTARVKVYYGPGIKEFSSQSNKSHFIKVTGLHPGLSYKYEVICSNNEIRTPVEDDSYQIRTACRPGEYFTFSVFGDPRPGDNDTSMYHQEVIDQILLQEPVFNLILGDMVDNGADDKLWEDFFGVEAALLRRSAVYPILGDNDYADGKGKHTNYFPKLEKGYYCFTWGGVYFFGLHTWDTRGRQPQEQFNRDSPQFQWFREEMNKPEVQAAPFRVVFLHDPVYICRGRASETLKHTWTPVFQEYKVDVVFASWHLYERSQDKGITYIISGGAGADLLWMNKNPSYPSQVDACQYHFCRVDVNAGAMTIRSISIDGTVLDTITLSPRSHSVETTKHMEKTARRLAKEIIINKSNPGVPVIPLYLFSYDCAYCRKLLRHHLPLLAGKNNIAFRVLYYDLSKQGTYDLFLNAGAEFGRQNSDIPAIFIGKTVIGGESEIKRILPQQIEIFLENPEQYYATSIVPFKQTHDTKYIGQEIFSTLTSGIILGAGLLDGINPCAFTTIIFLISYLTLVGASRSRILYTGGAFTFAVFLTYFMMGLVFFNVAKFILRNQSITKTVNVLLLVLVGILGVLSFVDFIKCLKGKAAEMTLQLPGFLKKGIHEKIRNFARHKTAVVGASFVLGVIIAGMELTCTGQVYIPIVTMISEPQHRVMAIFYLFLYNIAFIIPLAMVFLLVAFGLTSQKLANMFKRHIAGVKLGFAILFGLMAIMIIYNLRWL
ncbi:MAG: metallophosphoesterase [Candidatus Aminicenantes bacterium]|nr:MAG: metallophosphoesterase [Candidatus Aminicenantes bacterium]